MSLAEQLDAMCFKMGQEGLDYFLENYIDIVPQELRDLAEQAHLQIMMFEEAAKLLCKEHNVEYEQ